MSKELGKGTVLCDVDARGVVTVTLNRPKVNNAYNEDLISGLHEALDLLGPKPEARAIVIRGNGRHFQACADLEWQQVVGECRRHRHDHEEHHRDAVHGEDLVVHVGRQQLGARDRELGADQQRL